MPSRLPYERVLFDVEGTLYEAGAPIPGAAEAVAALRAAGLSVRFVTNTTRASRDDLVSRLAGLGIQAHREELFTAVCAAAEWCRREGLAPVLPLLAPEALPDLDGLDHAGADTASGPSPRAVVIGDLGSDWTYDLLQTAFRCLMEGAQLVACQRNRYWSTADGLALDAGPFVAALEYACGREAVLAGKPSPAFFRAALADDGIPPERAIVVGDDAEVDVAGAIAAGLGGWLVRTGKYRPGDETRHAPWPECVLDSVADLPEALEL